MSQEAQLPGITDNLQGVCTTGKRFLCKHCGLYL